MYGVAPTGARTPATTIVTNADSNNILTKPTGPEHQFSVGEGLYTLRDDLLLGVIPPHPTDNPGQTINVLDTKPIPPTSGSKISIAILARRRFPSNSQSVDAANSTRSVLPPSIQELPSETSHSGGSENGSAPIYSLSTGTPNSRTFGGGNPALSPPSGRDFKDPLKRRKPKSNIVKSSSLFISRVAVHDSFTKRLADHRTEGVFAFVNNNRALLWFDLTHPNKQEALTKILFTKAHPLCHDFNQITRTSSHMDLVIGFSSSDIMWYEPMSQKYTRLNKNGMINSHPVSHIRWMPNSESLFIATHFDGSLLVYDKEKDDAPFLPEEQEVILPRTSGDSIRAPRLHVKKSVQSKNQKTNPVCYWKVANDRINAFEFSPDGKQLAVVSEDGSLRLIDILREQLLDLYPSYYGGITCVCWSPDGRYLVTGGQDDLVSVWSVADAALVSRCEGHRSWITAVAFDPWRCDERTYRFGSVGEDCRLLLWDFSVGMLHRPRASSVRQRESISGHTSVAGERTQSQTNLMRSQGESDTLVEEAVTHPVQPRLLSAKLPPVLSKVADEHPLSWIGFEEDCIMTACRQGHIRTWDRPREGSGDG